MKHNSNSPLHWLRHWVAQRGDQPYMIQPLGNDQLQTLSWREAEKQARQMAAYLKAQDLPAGSAVAIISKNCAEWILADLAIWMAGHVSVPLYPTLTSDSVKQILSHSEARFVFVGKLDDWATMKPGVPKDLPGVAFTLAPADEQAYPRWSQALDGVEPLAESELDDRGDDAIATIIYTSGSTGTPKGVMHSFSTMAASVRASERRLDLGEHERVLSYLPLAHVAERMMTECCGLYFGFTVYFAESLDSFVQDLQRAEPTLFFSVPRLWTRFRQGVLQKVPEQKLVRMLKIPLLGGAVRKKVLKQLGLQQVRYAVTGAAPLPQSILQWYRALGLELIEGYGMSENFAVSHATEPGEKEAGLVGPPYAGIEHRIAEDGEIQVRGGNNMVGYFKDPERTAEAFTDDGWLRTGDRGEIDSRNRLRITGRTKELFKTGKGKYVAPAPIENKLGAHPAAEAVCVTGAGQPQPCALLMLSEEGGRNADRQVLEHELAELRERVNATLDPHEQIAFIAISPEPWTIEAGLLTPTMKIKRDAIETRFGAAVEAAYAQRQAVVWL